MKAIIVDDEPKAISLLEDYLVHHKSIELVSTFRNGLRAFEYINNNHVDIIFLDINMPHISGITLSKLIPPNIHIIFTTAHSDFAVESYEANTVDYLLKPISFERFSRAINKLINRTTSDTTSSTEQKILIKSGTLTHRVLLNDIEFLKKDGNYMTYYTIDRQIIARENVAESLSKLPNSFIQCHKSYIINIEHVDRYDKDCLFIGAHQIPISATFKDEVLKKLNQ